MDAFGVSTQQASLDLNAYIEQAKRNLVYDKSNFEFVSWLMYRKVFIILRIIRGKITIIIYKTKRNFTIGIWVPLQAITK